MILLATQILGFGMAGIGRRFLVSVRESFRIRSGLGLTCSIVASLTGMAGFNDLALQPCHRDQLEHVSRRG